jgi:UvrD-like helicase C-terminal domain
LEHREAGIDLRRQAVLFRASHHSDQLEVELARRSIPFVKYGGLKFLEAAHVKDMMSVLRWIENPRDVIAAFRALQLLPGVGPATARNALDHLSGNSWNFALNGFTVPPAAAPHWSELCKLLSRSRNEATPWAGQAALVRTWYMPHLERSIAGATSSKTREHSLSFTAFDSALQTGSPVWRVGSRVGSQPGSGVTPVRVSRWVRVPEHDLVEIDRLCLCAPVAVNAETRLCVHEGRAVAAGAIVAIDHGSLVGAAVRAVEPHVDPAAGVMGGIEAHLHRVPALPRQVAPADLRALHHGRPGASSRSRHRARLGNYPVDKAPLGWYAPIIKLEPGHDEPFTKPDLP